jgi:hypothetical protein
LSGIPHHHFVTLFTIRKKRSLLFSLILEQVNKIPGSCTELLGTGLGALEINADVFIPAEID